MAWCGFYGSASVSHLWACIATVCVEIAVCVGTSMSTCVHVYVCVCVFVSQEVGGT